MMAQATGLKAGDFVIRWETPISTATIWSKLSYNWTREPRALPRMEINPDVKSIFDFKFEDFNLTGYDPHPHIKGEVAV